MFRPRGPVWRECVDCGGTFDAVRGFERRCGVCYVRRKTVERSAESARLSRVAPGERLRLPSSLPFPMRVNRRGEVIVNADVEELA